MYNVSANFHSLAIADSPKTRCRIYFITDAVNCWDDNAVQTNGTLLVGAVGDTDSNGRIGKDGVTISEIFNKDKNLTLGGTVSYQIGMTLVNSDGALNNFAFGRCKVYLDVYDDANSTWLPCPLGVFRIELPVKRKVQLISCTGYDQMQVLNAIADTWWNGLNFTGGLTIANILNSMVTQLGLHLSATSSTNMVNTTLSFTTPPIDSVERTYRDILGWIAEATGTVAHFNRDGELDMRQYLTPQIGGNNIVIDTDTTGNQCLSIDVAEYSVSQIDALTIKLTTSDQGVTVGSGTNVYTIMDNPFLYGPDVATIQGKLTPIYNRLSAYATYSPISTRLIYDWSIEAGDIIYITNNSTTYNMPIFQQKMVWRGGYVTSELISSGDTVRPQVSSGERETYRYNVEMATKVGDNEIISKINQTAEQIQIQASKVNLTGYITATNLATAGQTVINGGNITTGELSADRIKGGILKVGGVNNTGAEIYLYDYNGVLSGLITSHGLSTSGTLNGQTVNSLVADGEIQLLQDGYGLAALLQMISSGPVLLFYYQGGRIAASYGKDGLVHYFSDQDYHIATHLGQDATRSFLTLNSPDGSSDIFLDTLPANGSRFNSPTRFNAGATVSNGLTADNATVNGVLDVTPRRCYATLSSAGWYRVMTIAGDGGGIDSWVANICITRSYNISRNETHSISLLACDGSFSFVDEISKSNTQGISDIRYVRDGSYGYIDIYYSLLNENDVCVTFDVKTIPTRQDNFVSSYFGSVAPTPSSGSVVAQHSFFSTTGSKITFSPSVGTSFNDYGGCYYMIQNGICFVHVGLSGLSASTSQVVFTLPARVRPQSLIAACGIGGASITAISRGWIYEDGRIFIVPDDQYTAIDFSYVI